jgi:putative GTP pyrophosphokinase
MCVQSQIANLRSGAEYMAWVEPWYSRSQVKREGYWLREQDAPINTEVIRNWRTSHGYPLHHFYISLKSRSRKVNPNSFVSQRLKRLPSIYAKLRRERSMQLTTMQDIAGCRHACYQGCP